MSRWFRHYAGMMRDEKLVGAAVKSKQPVERVVWIWGAILESAAEINDNGRFELDAAEVAYFLRADEADICAVLDALGVAGRVADGAVVRWCDRQFSSDKSKDRQAAYRERQRQKGSHGDDQRKENDGDVTSRDGEVTAQETDTETDKIEPKGSCASGDAPAFDVNDFVESWNETADACGLAKIRKLTDSRKRAFAVRRREYPDIADWQRAFRCLRENKWMHGDNKSGWRADPDFFLTASKFTKLVEGQYGQADR